MLSSFRFVFPKMPFAMLVYVWFGWWLRFHRSVNCNDMRIAEVYPSRKALLSLLCLFGSSSKGALLRFSFFGGHSSIF